MPTLSRRAAGPSLLILFTLSFVALTTAVASETSYSDEGLLLEQARPAVTMVISARQVGSRLVPIGSGSGTVIHSDGSVLTNFHVVADPRTREPHELFVIARFRAPGAEPELVCVGRPSLGKLKPDLDLALIKCDLDLGLRPAVPGHWPALPVGRSEEMIPGERIAVLGYPNVGAKTLQTSRGLLSGWMQEDLGAEHRAFMKTDAPISLGNSGGAALDKKGELVGVPTAFLPTTAIRGDVVVSAGKVGLIRPIEHARDLIAMARKGWTPSPDTEVPESADVEAPRAGVLVRSNVADASNRRPIEGAFAVAFRPEVRGRDVDFENLEAQALASGRTNARGEFVFDTPLKRGLKLTVAVFARGYRPLILDGALIVSDEAPSQIEPWPELLLARDSRR